LASHREVKFLYNYVVSRIRVRLVQSQHIGAINIDHAYVGFTQYIVSSAVSGSPVELLGIEFHNKGVILLIDIHNIGPGVQPPEDKSGQYNYRDDGPDKFQAVIVCKKQGLVSGN